MPPVQQFAVPVPPVPVAMPVPTPSSQSGPVHYAGFWIRFLALTLDNLIVGVVLGLGSLVLTLLVGYLLKENSAHPSTAFVIFSIVITILRIILQLGYFIVLTNKRQATIGKRLLGLRVVREDGRPLSLGKIILRETIGKLVSGIIIGVGYLMVAFTKKKQALHDIMSGSVVISNPEERKTWAFVVSIVIAAALPIIMIAIVGILSSVALISLGSARMKAVDEMVRSNFTSILSQAELVYIENHSSYATLCSDLKIKKFISDAETAETAKGVSEKSLCSATPSSYVVYIPTKNPVAPATGLCVDNTAYKPKETTKPLPGTTVCP